MLEVCRDSGPDAEPPLLPLQPVESPAECPLEHSGKGDGLESRQMLTCTCLWFVFHGKVRSPGDRLLGGYWSITQCQWMTGYYWTEFYHLQDGLNPSPYGATSFDALEWPSMSLSTSNLPVYNVPSAQLAEDTANKETIDPKQPVLSCTPDRPKMTAPRPVVGVASAEGGNIW